MADKAIELALPLPPTDDKGLVSWALSLHRTLDETLNSTILTVNALSRGELDVIRFNVQTEEPAGPEEGWVTYADGTSWDPGSGAGLYEYRSAAWRKL